MPEKVREIHPPRGFSRLGFRLPIWLYRLGLGGLLGKRFVCLTHTGRRSGKPRQTVLEVVRYDGTTGACIVAAGFGDQSDWVRNVTRDPQITVTVGRNCRTDLAKRLDPVTAGCELAAYARRYPLAWRELARFMGYRLNGSEEDICALGGMIPMFVFKPVITGIMRNKMKTVVAAALGECVHVAGVSNFLRLAESAGWRTVFLGPAVPIEQVLAAARREKAELVGVSYRLTPETGERLLGQFAEEADDLLAAGVRFVFGGTPPVAERVKALGFFERVFDGSEKPEAVLAFLKGQTGSVESGSDYPQSTVERIRWKSPYPLLRHHFGLPSMEDTLAGIERIAEAGALDVISLGTDQDAQENFFHPERQDPRRRGAGGVPVRTADDYRTLYAASRRGNFPLLRTYSGTDDFIRLAEMYVETIHNAWCAIPLFWFNQMDGRGPWDLESSIREHQRVMVWYGEHGIPVELNEPHHWGMRDALDVVYVVAAYLAAYNARKFGVRNYIAQMMFNSPPGLSDAMDLAKMLTVLELDGTLETGNFRVWRQVRTGLLSYPLDPAAARAHLAVSVYLQMALRPHIVHIVGHTEAHHAATADDVIESSGLARRAIENALAGQPDMTADPRVQARRAQLVEEAHLTLDAIRALAPAGVDDPLADPATLARAVATGILDAPQLKNNRFALGRVQTRIVDGACLAVHPKTGKPLSEGERLAFAR